MLKRAFSMSKNIYFILEITFLKITITVVQRARKRQRERQKYGNGTTTAPQRQRHDSSMTTAIVCDSNLTNI